MTLSVVHVVDSLAVGGMENGVVNIVAGLEGNLRQCVVLMTEAETLAGSLPPSVPVYRMGKRPGTDLRAIVRLARLLRRLAPDVVHSRNWGALDAVLAARLALVRTVIHGEHGRDAGDPHGLNRKRNRIRRVLEPLVTRYVTVSHDLRRWLGATVGIPVRKVVTIHNGVDTRRFSPDGRDKGRRALGLSQRIMVIGTVGRLDPVKNHLGLIEAFGRVPDPDCRLAVVIVGHGPCRSLLEERSAAPDVRGRVHLLGERSDVPILVKGLDVYVQPSVAEGLSNTILEAMATGLPVVATAAGGNPELVEDGVTGTLVPVGDCEALAGALSHYVADPQLTSVHGKSGRQRATAEFALERMVAQYDDLYRRSVADRTAARRATDVRPRETAAG